MKFGTMHLPFTRNYPSIAERNQFSGAKNLWPSRVSQLWKRELKNSYFFLIKTFLAQKGSCVKAVIFCSSTWRDRYHWKRYIEAKVVKHLVRAGFEQVCCFPFVRCALITFGGWDALFRLRCFWIALKGAHLVQLLPPWSRTPFHCASGAKFGRKFRKKVMHLIRKSEFCQRAIEMK